MAEVRPGYVAVGRVLAAWGLRGEVKVHPLTDRPDYFSPGRSLSLAGRPHTVEASRWRRGLLYLKLSGIDDREAAQALRGEYLELPESELAPLGEGEYYRYQLIGLAVESSEGLPLGRVASILSTPSNDVFVVQGDLGEVLIPAVDEIVKEVDLAGGRIVVEVVPGVLPPARGG